MSSQIICTWMKSDGERGALSTCSACPATSVRLLAALSVLSPEADSTFHHGRVRSLISQRGTETAAVRPRQESCPAVYSEVARYHVNLLLGQHIFTSQARSLYAGSERSIFRDVPYCQSCERFGTCHGTKAANTAICPILRPRKTFESALH